MFLLPEGWVGIFSDSQWRKPFGLCIRRAKLIEVHPPAWIPPWFGVRRFFSRIIWNHEALHAWGNPGCGHAWCLGYEAAEKRKEYLVMPWQLLTGLHFCDDCLGYMRRGTEDITRTSS